MPEHLFRTMVRRQVSMRTETSGAAETPMTRAEQAWFDRASN